MDWRLFDGLIYQKYTQLGVDVFHAANYKSKFSQFLKHHPVVLSSTLSLPTSIPSDHLFDYVIIDEASQVDVITASVCFACAQNAVVVGDSMQLPHIVTQEEAQASAQLLAQYAVRSCYNYAKHSVLTSLKSLYGEKLPVVLLKEHYRCHPAIIAFCNKKYYNNELLVMTQGEGCPFKIIETVIGGGYDNRNQRQVDETKLFIDTHYSRQLKQVGVIAPYRNQIQLLQKQLPKDVESDTIHRFQGREKDYILFNTVQSQINSFMDNPNLVNVAVSRAVKAFHIVKPALMELPHGSHIGDLIRYMQFRSGDNELFVKGSVCSVFDILYKEFAPSFQDYMRENNLIVGSPAEVIIDRLLTNEIFSDPRFASVDSVREYRLRDLIAQADLLPEEQYAYIQRNARLDFLLYNKMDKRAILAIEVDGVSFHQNNVQQEKRDAMKDAILHQVGIPILRLSTDGSNEKKRIQQALLQAMEG